jgi:hypothetical protein
LINSENDVIDLSFTGFSRVGPTIAAEKGHGLERIWGRDQGREEFFVFIGCNPLKSLDSKK